MMFKTQLICLIIVFFIGVYYLFTDRKKSKTHKWYVVLLVASLVHLFFDVLSVYTVNHLETVPEWGNRLVHQMFIAFMLLVFFAVYKYLEMVIKEEIGAGFKSAGWVFVPLAVAFLGVVFLPVYYRETPQGNYSYGPGPISIYVSITIYVILIIRMLIKYGRNLTAKKRRAIIVALLSQAIIATLQAIFPTWLISCLGITLLNLSFFVMLENPDAVLVELLQKETKRADVANQAKTTFLAHMSHEIRTPINAVLGMNEMILRESNEAQIIEYAKDVKSATNSLMGIINDILDITKIEAGKVTIIPVEYSLSTVLEEIISIMSFRAKTKQLDFVIEVDERIPDKLKGDDIRIKQILMNLLSNAIKYTKEGKVTLEARLLPQTTDTEAVIYFAVTDTGIGIKQEDIGRLYIPFERLEEKKNRSIEGTGLGMTIVMQILKLLDSKISIRSTYGEGSEFSFVLKQRIIESTPIGKLKDESKITQEHYVYSSRFIAPEAKILAVDDNEVNRRVFRSLLKNTRIQIDEASGGKECLEKVTANYYDIIFMDHMMPEMDGVETFKKMKEMEDYPCKKTPVVILTANAIAGAKAQYMTLGFQAFLPKPVDSNKLEIVVERLLKKDMVQHIKTDIKAPEEVIVEQKEMMLIDGVDWKYAYTHFNGHDAMMDALHMFKASLKREREELEKLYNVLSEADGMKNYCTKVHSMKNSAMLLGIIPLAGLAKTLEDAARNNEQEVIQALHNIFLKKWDRYDELLAPLFMDEEEQKGGTECGEKMDAIMDSVRTAAKDMDIDTLDTLLKELEKYSFEGEDKEKIEKIKEAIIQFNVEYLMEI